MNASLAQALSANLGQGKVDMMRLGDSIQGGILTMPNLRIDDVVDIVVSVAAAITPRDGFNVGLILGSSTHIATADRCIIVNGLDGLTDAGFTATDPEYQAATLYFGQTPAPGKLVVGVKGTDETWVEAITACRNANADWYGFMCASTGLTATDHKNIAAYAETLIACYFYSDKTAADLNDVTTDIFSQMKALSYQRSFGIYSTTDYAAAAALGLAMGSNDGTANSAFTMAYKTLTGVAPDDLSATQVAALQGKNANYYVTRGGAYKVLEKGINASGDWFDEILGLDQLAYNLQRNCMDVLATTRTKVPYSDAGAQQFVLACNNACRDAVSRGFLTPGVWRGATVLNLEAGDALTAGYLCQAEPVASRPSTEKALRICPPIYCCVNLAGAIHSATIRVNVQ